MIFIEKLSEKNFDSFIEYISTNKDILVQQTNEWRQAILDMETDEDIYLLAKNEKNQIIGYFPAFLYKNELGNIIQSNPYPASYGGVITNKEGDERKEIFKALLLAIQKVAKENSCLLITICTPPFQTKEDYALYQKYFQPDYEKENFYQYLKLKEKQTKFTKENFKKHLNRNLNRNINKAELNKLQINKNTDKNDLKYWHENILKERMTKIKGNIYPLKWFASLQKNLISKGKGNFTIIKKDDKIIGGGIFVYNKKVIDIYLRIIGTNYLKYGAGIYLDYFSILDASNKDFTYFNWQSSPKKESSTFKYKQKWGSYEGKHHYFTKVTGNIKKLIKTPLETIKKEYKFHFLLPYYLFEEKKMDEQYGFKTAQEKKFPSMVHLETNNICNLKCIHCPQRDIHNLVPNYKPESMPWTIFEKIIKEVAETNATLRFTNDGEPLIHPEFIKQVKFIQEKGIKTFAFNTNGVFLEKEVIDALLQENQTKIAVEVSFDAFFKDTYEKIRIGSDYIKVMKNIFTFIYKRNQKNLKNKKIMVSIVDQPEAKEEITLFKKFWEQVVDKVIIRKYVDTKGILESKNQEYCTKIKRWPCLLPFKRIMVGYDGKARFCPDDWKKESIIGDITKQNITDIWSSKEYTLLRKEHLELTKNQDIIKKRIPCNYCKEWQAIRWDYDYSIALKKLFA